MSENIKIAVVGSGYVGLVAAVCFAEIGHEVICVDNDERKVAALQAGDSLIHETSLPELLEKYRNTRVHFTADLAEATRECEAIFIAVGTPQSEAGDADLSYVEAVACEIARSITSYKVIVEKSTVPVYTNEWVTRSIERNGVSRHLFDVISNPEFLREGTAIADFLHPDRIVIGSDSDRAAAGAQTSLPSPHKWQLLQPDRRPRRRMRRDHPAAASADLNQERRDHQARFQRLSSPKDILHQRRLKPLRGR